jgi:enoyl-CoA hydratase/carnithine racemase
VAGRQAAAELLLTGRRVGGAEALHLGLCDRLAGEGEGELMADAVGFAGELSASAPLAVRSIRATLREGLVEAVRASMEHERAEQLALGETADFAEGVRAAAERREPRFAGK